MKFLLIISTVLLFSNLGFGQSRPGGAGGSKSGEEVHPVKNDISKSLKDRVSLMEEADGYVSLRIAKALGSTVPSLGNLRVILNMKSPMEGEFVCDKETAKKLVDTRTLGILKSMLADEKALAEYLKKSKNYKYSDSQVEGMRKFIGSLIEHEENKNSPAKDLTKETFIDEEG